MQNSLQPTSPTCYSALESGLSAAAVKIKASDVHAAIRQGLGYTPRVLGASAAAAAAVVVVSRLFGFPATVAAAVVIAAGTSACGVVVAAYWLSSRRRLPSLHVVAERLDMAIADHNSIASALDLARSGDRSPFSVRAITAGVELLRTASEIDPVLPKRTSSNGRGWVMIFGGVALLALSYLTPIRLTNRLSVVTPHDLSATVPSSLLLATDDRHPIPTPPHRDPVDAPMPGSPTPSKAPVAPTPSQQQSQAGASPSSDSTGNSAGGPSQVANSASGTAKPKPASHNPSVDEGGEHPDPARTPDETPNHSMQLASFGAAPGDAALSHNSPHGSSGGNSDDANAPLSKVHTPSGSGSQAPPKDAKATKQSNSGDGDGSPGASKMASENKGGSMASGEGEGGRGQSSGANAPKKSRGVAPLMLGTPDPDLFEGKQLPGPDERTRLQVTPKPVPADIASAASAAARQDDEPPVPVYRVPAESRRSVDDYFERLHQDDGTATAGK